ncbi:MAG TPA: hypothetical protein VEB20_25490 [Azospirillaceae bacterium]|nr:hypothetical protein [Azospirillaceae bacterium]
MSKLIQVILVVLLVAVVGTVVFLGTWDMPAPSAPVERVIPNDRFQQ